MPGGDIMPTLPEPAWPPTEISPPPPGAGPRFAHIAPKWQRPDFIPTLELIDWALLDEHREAHAAALAALENACGSDPATADQDKLRDALAELRRISIEAVRALQAEDAAKSAFEDFAHHRQRLTAPAAGIGGGMTPVPVSRENEAAAAHNAKVASFYAENRREREALRRDHDRLVEVLGPSFQVVDDEETVRLLGIGDPEPLPGREPGEPASAPEAA